VDIEENTIRFEVPEGRSFRLDECDAFWRIEGDTPNDVDVVWQNEGDDRLWLVELKDYGELIPADPDREYLQENLTDKIRDVLYLLASLWAESDFGRRLRRDVEEVFPTFPETKPPLRPVAVLNLEEDQEALTSALMTDLNTNGELMSILSVMDVSHVLVVDPDHPFVEDELQVEIETGSPRDAGASGDD
jgi:hypothetical protein